MGASLPLRVTITGGFFAEEIVRTLVGSIGLVLAIPLTTAIAALVATTARAEEIPPLAEDSIGHRHCRRARDAPTSRRVRDRDLERALARSRGHQLDAQR